MKWSAVLLLGVWLGSSAAAQAGVIVDIENQEVRGGARKLTSGRLYLDTDRLKMVQDTEEEGDAEIIYQGKEKRLLLVDHASRSATSIDAETMRAFVEQMQMMQKQMQDALSQLPAEQRQAAEEMMKQRMPPGMDQAEPLPIEITALEGTEEKEGRTCRGWEVHVGGALQSRIWASEWKDVDIGKEDFQPFVDMAAFFQELLQSMPMMAQDDSADLFSGLDEIQGFPVVVESYEDGELVEQTFFRNARREKLDERTFEPPAGYDVHSLQEQMGR